MKITDTKEIRAMAAARAITGRAADGDRPVGERVSTEDSQRLSATVAAAAAAAGPSRAARLAGIEAAVRQGTYRPDPRRIAQQILDDAELAARLQALLGG